MRRKMNREATQEVRFVPSMLPNLETKLQNEDRFPL